MESKIPSYLRTYRKRNGLTQDETAFLLGYQSGTKVSRFERLARKPNLETALACEVVFGVPANKLFPSVYADIEQRVNERARLLASRLQENTEDSPSKRKRKLKSLNAI